MIDEQMVLEAVHLLNEPILNFFNSGQVITPTSFTVDKAGCVNFIVHSEGSNFHLSYHELKQIMDDNDLLKKQMDSFGHEDIDRDLVGLSEEWRCLNNSLRSLHHDLSALFSTNFLYAKPADWFPLVMVCVDSSSRFGRLFFVDMPRENRNNTIDLIKDLGELDCVFNKPVVSHEKLYERIENLLTPNTEIVTLTTYVERVSAQHKRLSDYLSDSKQWVVIEPLFELVKLYASVFPYNPKLTNNTKSNEDLNNEC